MDNLITTYIPHNPRQHKGCHEGSNEFKEDTAKAERLWYDSGVCYIFDNLEVIN